MALLQERSATIAMIKERIRCHLDAKKTGFIEVAMLHALMSHLGSPPPHHIEHLLRAFGIEEGSLVQYEDFLDWLWSDLEGDISPSQVADFFTDVQADVEWSKLDSVDSEMCATFSSSSSVSIARSPKSNGNPSPLLPIFGRSAKGGGSPPSKSSPQPLLPISSVAQVSLGDTPKQQGPPLLPIPSFSSVNSAPDKPGLLLPSSALSRRQSDTKPALQKISESPMCKSSPSSSDAWKDVKRSDFKTVGYLGEGGFGQVRLVLYLADGEKYAMKSIEHALIKEMCMSGLADSIKTPMRERDIGILCREWRSPFIVQLFATFQTPDKLHYVYELCPGGDLFDMLLQQESGRFMENDAQFYIAEMSLGLAHLHSNNILHGDVKLENALIAKDSHVKLTDLGSAIVAQRDVDETQRNVQATFEPPEVRNGGGEFGKDLDCWQLGYAATAMLCGNYLDLDQGNVESILQQMLSGVGASEDAQALCQALLANDRQHRLGFPDGAAVLRTHAFFASLDWGLLEEKLVEPPFVFDEFPDHGRGRLESSTPRLAESRTGRVRGFTWSNGPDSEDWIA